MKTNWIKQTLLAGLALVGILVASGAFAQATTTFQVSASVGKNCLVSATNMGFGTYDPLAADTTATSTISVRCTTGTPFTVDLNEGLTSGSTILARQMSNGTDNMQYNLYTDSGHTTVWGDGLTGGNGSGVGAGMGGGNAVDLTVYGLIPTGQNTLTTGLYQENAITVTVNY